MTRLIFKTYTPPQKIKTCYDKIELCAQNVLTIHNSIVNTIGKPYSRSEEDLPFNLLQLFASPLRS